MAWSQEIGSRMREAREAKGLKLSEVADLLLVHRNALSKYEAGEPAPFRELPRIAEVLDVDLRWLLHGRAYEDPMEGILERQYEIIRRLTRLESRLGNVQEALEIPGSEDESEALEEEPEPAEKPRRAAQSDAAGGARTP